MENFFLSIGLGFLLLCSNMVGSSAFAWPCDICWNQTTKNDCNSISECQWGFGTCNVGPNQTCSALEEKKSR